MIGCEAVLAESGASAELISRSPLPVVAPPPLRRLLPLLLIRAALRPVSALRALRLCGHRRTLAALALRDTSAALGIRRLHGQNERQTAAMTALMTTRRAHPIRPVTVTSAMIVQNAETEAVRAIRSLGVLSSKVLVLDGGSEDATARVCGEAGAEVIFRAFDRNFAAQRNYLLNRTSTRWVVFVDADEELGPGLDQEIMTVLGRAPRGVDAVIVPRLNYVDGLFIPWFWPDPQPRAHVTKRRYSGALHEQVRYRRAIVIPLTGPFLIHHKTIESIRASHQSYSEIKGEPRANSRDLSWTEDQIEQLKQAARDGCPAPDPNTRWTG